MDKSKKQLAMLSVILIVLFIVSIRAIIKIKRSRSRLRQAETTQEKLVTTPVAQGELITLDAKGEGPKSVWGQDPFTGKSIRSGFGQTALFQLTGIIYNSNSPEESYAIIDNSVLRVGDTLQDSGMKLIHIAEEEVILSDGSKEMKVKLW